MAKTVQIEPVATSAVDYKPKTIEDMRAIYRLWRGMWKMKGAEKEFVAKYGSEKVWVGQFKRQPYDGRA